MSANPPVNQAKSPVNGVVPPPENRWKPGQSGNPHGRPSFGATAREWANELRDAPTEKLQKLVRNDKTPAAKATAAMRVLRARLRVDPADFEPVTRGEKTLSELAQDGVDTSVIKKLTHNKDGSVSLEFHDWSGQEFDRLMDRTEGRPSQAIEHTGKDGGPIQVEAQATHALISLLGGDESDSDQPRQVESRPVGGDSDDG